MEISFPLEFIVEGTPVSLQARRAESREEWKERVKNACSSVLPEGHFAVRGKISVKIYYFPDGAMEGDIDNIVKLILDALCRHVYMDDSQVERVVVQKFEPGSVFGFKSPSATLANALAGQKPLVYVHLSNDPFEELI